MRKVAVVSVLVMLLAMFALATGQKDSGGGGTLSPPETAAAEIVVVERALIDYGWATMFLRTAAGGQCYVELFSKPYEMKRIYEEAYLVGEKPTCWTIYLSHHKGNKDAAFVRVYRETLSTGKFKLVVSMEQLESVGLDD